MPHSQKLKQNLNLILDKINKYHFNRKLFLTVPVTITSLEQTISAAFTLNCSSSGSPPTNITWTKDGEAVMFNNTFIGTQYLRNSQSAVYDNMLSIRLPIADIVGTYTCAVDNQISQLTQATLAIEGKSLVNLVFFSISFI